MYQYILLGISVIVLGLVVCLISFGELLLVRNLSNLKRYGVEGEAISVLEDWPRMNRVYYDVVLPEGAPKATFVELYVEPRGPVGTVVPVVYDPRKPSRAKTGFLKDIDDREIADRWFHVKLFLIPGLTIAAVGLVLPIVFALV